VLTVLFSLQFALAEPPCDPADEPQTEVGRDLDRVLNDSDFLDTLMTPLPQPEAELPDPFAPTPQEDCNKKGLSKEEQAELARLKLEKQSLDSLIKALRTAKKGQIPIETTKDFIGSEVWKNLMDETKGGTEEDPGLGVEFAENLNEIMVSGDTSSLPDEYQVLYAVVTETLGQAGVPPLTVQGVVAQVLTNIAFGAKFAKSIPGAVNPFSLAIFTSMQTYDAAIKIGKTMESAAMATLYHMAAEVVIDGKTSAINGSGVDTLLKTPEGKALIRQATGRAAPIPRKRGYGIFDRLVPDRFHEVHTQAWMRANAMEIYTYLNLYMEAGGKYPLALYNDLVARGFVPKKYEQTNWRKNVLPHHQRARDELDRRIRALEEKARKNCF
jgi:hypothetical protein